MNTNALPSSPISDLKVIELREGAEPLLQQFFEDSPLYFLSVNGEPAQPQEAHDEIHGPLPAGWAYTKKWVLGYVDDAGRLAAMANIVSDLLAPGVWHIGAFIVATARHGSGDAPVLYRGLEEWAARNGARWLRLGVVHGNRPAERFWARQGCTEARLRHGIGMGKRTNTLRVMFKPLAGGSLEEYLNVVERDRPTPDDAA